MFTIRALRIHGLTWSQLKGLFQQSLVPHTCPQNRPGLLVPHLQCVQLFSTAFDSTQTVSAESSATPEVQQSELTQKGIGRLHGEQDFKLLLKPDQPADAKILQVAIIGLPNSGKSTLTNHLMGWRVSSVSKKVHTTRKNTTGICTYGNTQIVFLDTPGILHPATRKRHNLEKTMVIDPEKSLHQADLVCVIVDVTNWWTRNNLDPLVLQILHLHQDKPAILILNKVDLVKSRDMLLQTIRTLTQGIVDGRVIDAVTKKKTSHSQKMDFTALFDAMQPDKQLEVSNTDSHSNDRTSTDSQHFAGENRTSTDSQHFAGENRTSTDSQHFADENRTSTDSQHFADENRTSTDSQNHASPESAESSRQTSSPEVEEWNAYIQRIRTAKQAVRDMKGWPHFKEVFTVSALQGEGVANVKDYLLEMAKPGDWEYHSSLVTSQEPRELVLMCVKEKLLEYLPQEMPYNMTLDIVLWEVDEDGMFNVIINVNTANRRQVSYLLGPKGQTILKIASEAKQEMMNAFRCEMRLKLIARTKKTSKR